MASQPPVYRPAGWRERKPFANSRTAPQRLRGRAGMKQRERIRQRDCYVCQGCGMVTTRGEVDHRIPLASGGSNDDSNLQWLCIEGEDGGCHGRKTATEGGVSKKSRN